MEKIKIDSARFFEGIKKRAKEIRGKEYRFLWVTVNFAIVKDEHIRNMGGARAFGIFMILRSYMNKEGIAYPSLETIAYLAGCGETTIQKELKLLAENNRIEKLGKMRNLDGTWGNMKYRILERDLVRGSGQKGYLEQPLVESISGD